MVPQRLALDFVAPPVGVRVGRALLAIGAIALLAGGINLALAWQEQQRERTLLASLAQRDKQQDTSARRTIPVNIGAMRVAASVARDLTAPWPELLRSMEASRSSDVTLVRVEPVAARGSLRITADARHSDAMLDYLEQLRAQGLAEVMLTSHQVQAQQPGTPIRFQAQARWAELATRPGETEAPRLDSPEPATVPAADLTATDRFILNARVAR